MTKWLQLARGAGTALHQPDNSDNSANSRRSGTIVTNVPIVPGLVPPKSCPGAPVPPATGGFVSTVADAWSTQEERAALLEFVEGLSRKEAEHHAATEAGLDDRAAFVTAVLEAWRTAILAAEPVLPIGEELRVHALGLVSGPHAAGALQLGWDELGLLGIHPEGLLDRPNCLGLVPAAVAAGLPAARLLDLGPHEATLLVPGGGVHHQPRFRAGMNEAVALWSSCAFVGPRRRLATRGH